VAGRILPRFSELIRQTRRPVANAVLLKLILLLTGALYVPEELAQEIDGVLVPQGYHLRSSTLLPREIYRRLGKEKMRSLLFSASHVACRELLDLHLCKRERIKR
jgi:hypothetical protein